MKANKTTGRESKMTLVHLIIDPKTHISATLEKFDPMEMLQRQRERE